MFGIEKQYVLRKAHYQFLTECRLEVESGRGLSFLRRVEHVFTVKCVSVSAFA